MYFEDIQFILNQSTTVLLSLHCALETSYSQQYLLNAGLFFFLLVFWVKTLLKKKKKKKKIKELSQKLEMKQAAEKFKMASDCGPFVSLF